ncbi:MAG: hypothetical protein ACRD6N_08350, partial [Pyrinomonadaceae bacterium]
MRTSKSWITRLMPLCGTLFLLTYFAATTSVVAQTSNTGTITGVVKDEKGGLVPGASVKIINAGTNTERTASTS